jgi:ligand-binding SRPBCC domain-containing protein
MSRAKAGLHRLVRSQRVSRPREVVFAFFADASNLEAITPPFLRFRILTPTPIEMRTGTRIDYALSLFGFPLRWRSRITAWEPGSRFVDEQEAGPYAIWRHTHEFECQGQSTIVHDTVEYSLPLGLLGSLVHALIVERTLDRIFDFRRDAIRRLLDSAVVPPRLVNEKTGDDRLES